jgi:hypothetical protein
MLGELTDKIQIHHIAYDTVLCKENFPGNCCYILMQGKLAVYKEYVYLATIDKFGSLFGEVALDDNF